MTRSRAIDRAAIVASIHALLDARAPDATICPSDVARALAGSDGPWRHAMPVVRAVAAELVEQGRLRVTRRGQTVDAMTAGGPIRLGRPKP